MKMPLFYKGAKRPKTVKPLRYAVRRKVKLKLQCLMSCLRMKLLGLGWRRVYRNARKIPIKNKITPRNPT